MKYNLILVVNVDYSRKLVYVSVTDLCTESQASVSHRLAKLLATLGILRIISIGYCLYLSTGMYIHVRSLFVDKTT